MEIFGIGPSELIFVVIIALIILGPKDMQKAGKTIGKWMRDIVTSDGWKMFQQTSRDLRNLPNRLMREANDDLNQIGKDLNNASNPSIGSLNTPKNPPRSQPIPANPTPAIPAEKILTPQKEEANPISNESDQQKDA
jgi:sec-independent protein translocase protein TatB